MRLQVLFTKTGYEKQEKEKSQSFHCFWGSFSRLQLEAKFTSDLQVQFY
jgi:hypothetical protein